MTSMTSSELSEQEIEDQFNDDGFEQHKLKTAISKMFGKIPPAAPVATDSIEKTDVGQQCDRDYASSIIASMRNAWKRLRNTNAIVPEDKNPRNVM